MRNHEEGGEGEYKVANKPELYKPEIPETRVIYATVSAARKFTRKNRNS